MTVCRYFLQGKCRYGDRCRFEHPENNYSYDQRNVSNYQERQGYGQSNYYRHDNQYRNQGYDGSNYNGYERSYSPDRYSENYRHEAPVRQTYDAYDSQQYNRYQQGYEQPPRYNEPNYRRNQQYSNNYRNENTYGQNPYRWSSDDYKKHTQQNVQHAENKYTSDYSTSTPKEKTAFSFKVPESEIKKGSGFSHYQVDEQDQLYADRVKEDAKAWELGGLWPFTCYFPCPDKFGFPGFCDISPEELRYAAYKAEENNAYDSYIQSVQNALVQISQQRSQLQIPTPDLLATLRQIRQGENLCLTSRINFIPFLHYDEMASDEIIVPDGTAPTNSAASFSFKMATETDSSTKPNAANFSFKLPTANETSSVVSLVSSGDPDVYTPLENLTEEEKEQFTASTFVLGKIPTKPPPQVLCI